VFAADALAADAVAADAVAAEDGGTDNSDAGGVVT
jgi:hypothetical protein